MKELFEKGLTKAEFLINEHNLQYQQLVDRLLVKETLEGLEVEEIVYSNIREKTEDLIHA